MTFEVLAIYEIHLMKKWIFPIFDILEFDAGTLSSSIVCSGKVAFFIQQ